jgi:ATP-dependent Clp endopeptidase proteolytic subunit ClpP
MTWYKIESKSPEKAEIWIYEQIGEDWWTGEGVTAKKFQKELTAIKAPQIDLHINSPGGSVFDGVTIYNLLKQHAATVTTYIDGLAASIASVIALAGDKVVMAANALFMIHNPSGMVRGTATDMRDFADVLEKIGGTMVQTYVSATEKREKKKTEEELKSMMDVDTWMTAEEALEFGFIDEISDDMDMAACAKFVPIMAKAGFKNIPDISAAKQEPTARELERILRDAGCSTKRAKAILAKGYSEDFRDEDPPSDTSPAMSANRDGGPQEPARRDRIADLLVRAERVAPAIN